MITHPQCILSDEATDVITGVGGKTYLVYKHPSTKITTIIDKATQEKEFIVAKEISCTAALWPQRSICANVMRSYTIISHFALIFEVNHVEFSSVFPLVTRRQNVIHTKCLFFGFELVLFDFCWFIFSSLTIFTCDSNHSIVYKSQ